MKINMKLKLEPFNKIKNGQKIVEVRLNDAKRQQLNLDDEIEFINMNSRYDYKRESIKVKVIGKSNFQTFEQLYKFSPCEIFGFPNGTTLSEQIESMYKFYTKEQEKQLGVVAIHMKLLK